MTICDRIKRSGIYSSNTHRLSAFFSAKYSGIIGSSGQEMQASLKLLDYIPEYFAETRRLAISRKIAERFQRPIPPARISLQF
jgi:hypothetical protein